MTRIPRGKKIRHLGQQTYPVGRLDEVRQRPDADRIGYTTSGLIGEDVHLVLYPDRASLMEAVRRSDFGIMGQQEFRVRPLVKSYGENPGVREIDQYVRDYESAKHFLSKHRDRPTKLANNTTVEWLTEPFRDGGGVIGVKLHHTYIVQYHEGGTILLNTGGYASVTTKQRMNQLLRGRAHIAQVDFDWFLTVKRGEVEMGQRAVLWPDGSVETLPSQLRGFGEREPEHATFTKLYRMGFRV